MPKLSEIGEDELVSRLIQTLPNDRTILTGPGDDCAVVQRPNEHLLLKVDAMVEGVHFLRSAAPALIGRKALARAISDVAAMGGAPKYAMVTLVLPSDLEFSFVLQMYKGMVALAEGFGVSIVGGETTRGPCIMISVTITGEIVRRITRNGAEAGDVLFVTGLLGGSLQGRHLTFQPRVREAQWLVHNLPPTSMMDISDGLAKDLPRLARASGLDFIVQEDYLPCTPGCTAEQAWSDGEDYELLFTVSPSRAPDMLEAWEQMFPDLSVMPIGKLVKQGEGIPPNFARQGWDHFAKQK
ncbi:MAG: thiamine-phosphate kinase [Verrucomicrobiaceae bacterium]